MKNLYLMRKVLLGTFTMTLAMSTALAQANKPEAANAGGNGNKNVLNARHNAGAAKASKPVFESDGTPANDAALGIPLAASVTLPDVPKIKVHGKHKVSHGPVKPQEYPSTPQQEVKALH